jgi:hypothetical protein
LTQGSPPGHRRARPDPRPVTAAGLDETALAQRLVRSRDRRRRYPELRREGPHRWQRGARRQRRVAYPCLDTGGYLRRTLSANLITYWHSLKIVLEQKGRHNE